MMVASEQHRELVQGDFVAFALSVGSLSLSVSCAWG
jgi:hypothetical protein